MLSPHDVAYLKDCGIACTKDNYKYEYTIDDGTYGKTGQGGKKVWEQGREQKSRDINRV